MEDTITPIDIRLMLMYVGIQSEDMERVYSAVYYWDFVKSLTIGFKKYGKKLTDKQVAALRKSLSKKFPSIEYTEVLSHTSKYGRTGGSSQSIRKMVLHRYGKLDTIQLVDLPFEEGELVTLDLYGYNKHSVVFTHNEHKYKIPKPTNLTADIAIGSAITIKAKYHRTKCKGYLQDIKLVR